MQLLTQALSHLSRGIRLIQHILDLSREMYEHWTSLGSDCTSPPRTDRECRASDHVALSVWLKLNKTLKAGSQYDAIQGHYIEMLE